jgi:hypothetical protein
VGATLVLEDHLSAHILVASLNSRGFHAVPVADLGLGGKRPDADLVREIDDKADPPWTFVTLDLTIIDDASGFDWNRYAIAWIMAPKGLKGGAFEEAKQNIVHKHVEKIVAQQPGDHWTYTERSHYKHPPSLVTER